MTGADKRDDESDGDAAEAFEALRAEVAAVRRTVEALPDTTLTLAEIARGFTIMQKHPALLLTPQMHAEQLQAAQARALRQGEQTFAGATGRVEAAARSVVTVVDQARTSSLQNLRLIQMGAGGLVGGMIVWAAMSGPIARRLPESWAVPEKMAAATLGMDRTEAGLQMLKSVDANRWRNAVYAVDLVEPNVLILRACHDRAAKTGRPVQCGIVIKPAATR